MAAKTSKFARIVSLIMVLAFAMTLLPSNFALADDVYTFTLTSDKTSVKTGENVTLKVTIDGAMKELSTLQYFIKYDTDAFSVNMTVDKETEKAECLTTEWFESLGVPGSRYGKGLGWISSPLISNINGRFKMIFFSAEGRTISEKSDLYNANTANAGEIIFTAKKDVNDLSKTFTLLEGSDLVLEISDGEKGIAQKVKAVQLPSSGEPTDPDKEKVDAVIAKIAALPEADALTLDDETAVNEAKAAFDALSAENQAKVTNSDKLTKALAKIEELKNPPASDEYVFTLTSDKTSVKTGENVTLKVTIDGAMKELSTLQYFIRYDTDAFSIDMTVDKETEKAACLTTEWFESLGVPGSRYGKGLGWISSPLISNINGRFKMIFFSAEGRTISEKSDLYNANTANAGEIIFTAKKDVSDLSKTFTLLEGSDLVLEISDGEKGIAQKVKAVQLPSSGEPDPDPDKEAVEAVIAKIAALPEADALTLDDETAVNEAKAAFDALNAENQAKVTNSDKLTKALAKIEELKAAASDQEKVDAVIKMINDLPATDALTLADKEAVASASAAYEALGELKGKVTNADKLTAAINKIADLEKDKDAADKVIALIDAIDAEITLDSEEGITNARTAYDALTPAQKALISAEKLEVLTNAEAVLKGIKADKAAADNVIKMIDDICASEITVGSRAAIDAAKKAYDELNGNGQKFVGEDKYNELLEADKKCKELEDAADQDTKDTAAAEAFTKAVNDLEDATYENVDTVEAAVANLRSQYDSLTDGAKAKIDEKVLAKLTEIEEKVKTIKNDIAKANETKALIKAIGTVTLDSADAIKAARDSYDALENAEQKALVDNAPDGENTATLEAAEKAYAAIKEDNDKADATIKLIDDIGEVTIDSGDKIKAARESFDSLTDAQKEKVKKAGKEDILVKAEADYKAIVDANKPVVSGNKKPAFTDMFDGGLYVVLVENVPTGKKVTVDGIEGYEYKDADGKIKYVVASNREMNTDNITVEDATDAKPFILGAFTNPTGALNAADAYIINKLSALIKDDTTNPLFADPYTMLRADVNGDGIINAADALLVARHAAGDATAPALKFVEIATIDAE